MTLRFSQDSLTSDVLGEGVEPAQCRAPLRLAVATVILAGDPARVTMVANELFDATQRGVLWAPRPIFTVIPGWDETPERTGAVNGAGLDPGWDAVEKRAMLSAAAGEALIGRLRDHHDLVLAPTSAAGRPVFCVGAWWRLPAVVRFSGGMPITLTGDVWPSTSGLVVLDFDFGPAQPGRPQLADGVFDIPRRARIPASGRGELIASCTAALHRFGVLSGLGL